MWKGRKRKVAVLCSHSCLLYKVTGVQAPGRIDNIHGSGPTTMTLNTEKEVEGTGPWMKFRKDTLGIE